MNDKIFVSNRALEGGLSVFMVSVSVLQLGKSRSWEMHGDEFLGKRRISLRKRMGEVGREGRTSHGPKFSLCAYPFVEKWYRKLPGCYWL